MSGFVLRMMQRLIETRQRNAQITFSGDVEGNTISNDTDVMTKRLPTKEDALIISNHVAWSDFYLVHALAQHHDMLNHCKYFVKVSKFILCKMYGFNGIVNL